MSEFRFSPRANRANEIAWQPWGRDAFDRATREDKPILLAISAVWCHWCHVMDETTYSDAGVIETINRRFVPVRVDNDHRPDVNARYNMGGWPTTAFLAPDGTTLTGATYLPPQQMRRALEEVADFFREHKHEIAERIVKATEARGSVAAAPPEDIDLDAAPIARLLEDLRASFDHEYGGFGNEPKFPQPEVHEFLIDEWRHGGGQDLHDMAARTLLGNGARRNVRSRRGRLLSLLDDARLERAALREDGRRSRRPHPRARRSRALCAERGTA